MIRPIYKVLRRLLFHVELGAGVGLVVGLCSAAIALDDAAGLELPVGVALLGGGGAGVLYGATLGALLGVVVTSARFVLDKVGGALRGRTAVTDDDHDERDDRGRMVRLYTDTSSLVVVGGLAVWAFAWFLEKSERIRETALRDKLVVIAAASCIVVTVAFVVLARPLLMRAFRRMDQHGRLPFPKGRLNRYLLYLLLPSIAVTMPMFLEFGEKLGVVATLFGAVLFVVFVRGLAVFGRELSEALAPVWPRGEPVLRWIWRAGLIACAVCASWLFERYPLAAYAREVRPLRAAVGSLQRLTDVDGDGISSMFGGADCAPFDADVSPARRDIPNNGIDEDCDGVDASLEHSGLPVALKTFSGRLPSERVKRYNVLWYIVDSLRADHLPLYGYHYDTSPFLTRLGQDSLVFERAYSQSSNTSLSVPSMFAGRFPDSMQWERSSYPIASPDEVYLAPLLRERGYHTGLILNPWVQKLVPGIQHGFERLYLSPPEDDWRSGLWAASNVAIGIQDAQQAGRPFFLVVHADDAHHPYRSHESHAVPEFPSSNGVLMNYDRGIAVFDASLQAAITHLKNVGLFEETIVIVTADHGEEFREHGGTIHSQSCYEEVVHVPLVVRIPGIEPRRISTRVGLTDLAPTLLELLGEERVAMPLDGQSLLMHVLDPDAVPHDRPIFCSIFQMLPGRERFFTRSVRTEHRTLMHELLSDRVELYDNEADPGQRDDIAGHPVEAETIRNMMQMLKASVRGNLFEARTFK